jgi:hypothetical protein
MSDFLMIVTVPAAVIVTARLLATASLPIPPLIALVASMILVALCADPICRAWETISYRVARHGAGRLLGNAQRCLGDEPRRVVRHPGRRQHPRGEVEQLTHGCA